MGERYLTTNQEEAEKEIAAHLALWIRSAETAIERLAAETGKAQIQSFGIRDDAGRTLLRIHFTCEPREFAKRTIEGAWAPGLNKSESQPGRRVGGGRPARGR